MEFCIAGFLKRGLFAGTRSVSVARNSTRGSCVCLSSVSKSGDKGAKKNFDRKVKKNAKKTTKLDVANLVSSLQSFEKHGRQQASETNERENKNLREFLSNINFQQSEVKAKEVRRRTNIVRRTSDQQLFVQGPRLGVFRKHDASSEVMPELAVDFTEEDRRRQVELLTKLKTKNEFEIMMEESDRMWSYPVDNEVVKTNEENVGFEEHVLLDHHLKDFPQRGPVRRFMEMVVTGLSKNPYYTVKEKHQQIQWYKKYFSKFSPEDLQGAALGVDFHPTNPEKEYQGKSEPRKTDKKKRTSSSK